MTSASDKEAVVSNSMNPFAESAADVKKKEEKGAKEKEAANQPKWKVGWKRVSTRQWIRDFRDHVVKFQTFPYKTICGMLFWSFGYYPDMVGQESYQKYVAKFPLTTKRYSIASDGTGAPSHYSESEMSSMVVSTTELSTTSTVSATASDANANAPAAPRRRSKVAEPVEKERRKSHAEPPPPVEKEKRKSHAEGERKKSIKVTDSVTSATVGGKKDKKGKKPHVEDVGIHTDEKKKKRKSKVEESEELSEVEEKPKDKKKRKSKAEAEPPATEEEDGGKKKKKKDKKKGGEEAAPETATEEEGGKKKDKKKGKKGKEEAEPSTTEASADEGKKEKKGKKKK